MSQAGYTPIQLYFSTTAAAVPVNTNLANGELAINITDGKLYYKDNGGTVRLLASNATSAPVLSFSAGTTGFTPSTATTGAITLAGTLATTNGGTGLTSFTANQVFYASSTSAFAQSANLTFNGTTLTVNDITDSSLTVGRVTYAGTAGNLIDSANLTFDGTNLGVGLTPTGQSRVHVYTGNNAVNGIQTQFNASNFPIALASSTSAGFPYLGVNTVQKTSSNTQTYAITGFASRLSASGGGFQFSIAASGTAGADITFTEAMTLDTSGNLGLGVTPSAWSLGKGFEVGFLGNGVFSPSQGVTNIVNNTYYASSSYRYATTAAAAYYSVNSGLHQWYTAASGTAGNAISFTQAMTLDASGNLLVGTTTLRTTGYTTATNQYAMETTGYGGAQWFTNRTDSEGSYVVIGKSRGTTVNSNTVVADADTLGAIIWQGATGSGTASAAQVRAKVDGSTISSSSMPGRLEFYTTPSGSTTMSERLRIANNGAWGLSGANYGSSGQVLTSGGASAAPTWTTVSSGGTPGGSTTQVQYNNAGAFAGSANMTFDGTNLTVGGLNAPNTFGFKNRIINGNMSIDQRNAGASVTPTDGAYTLDRWVAYLTAASKFSVQQNAGAVTPPTGFTNYLGVTSLSAYSVSASDYFVISQRIEGFNTADLAWGTANAQTVVLSFWIRSSLTGAFGGTLMNNAGTQSYPFTYTISSANTWELKSIVIAGSTTGTWVTTNGRGVQVQFGLGVGSNFVATTGAWASSEEYSSTGATSVVGTNGATWYITGVQLEKGNIATSFDVRSIGTELALCQRYCTTINDATTSGYIQGYGGGCRGTTYIGVTIPLPVAMRSTPSLSNVGGTVRLTVAGSKVDSASSSMTIGGVTPTIGYSAYSGNLAITYIGGPVTGLTGIANDVCVTFFTNGDGKLFALSEL